MTFVGRQDELSELTELLDQVRRTGRGRAVLLRGRRRLGKSLLAEVLVQRCGVPHVFSVAVGGAPAAAQQSDLFRAISESDLPDRGLVDGVRAESWRAALHQLAASLPSERPSIVVLDEVPYLAAADPSFEGSLQAVWDRELAHKPVLMLLIGSDLSMMEQMGSYGRPFHQRGTEMVLGPLNPRDVSDLTGAVGADAFDAWLVTGGLPLVCAEMEPGADVWAFLRRSLSRSTSALVVSGTRILAAEFPAQAQARAVLGAIGSGERTFSGIAGSGAGLNGTSLSRALSILQEKRVVTASTPYSLRPADKERRYAVADPYLRFFLRFVHPGLDEIDRGRGDVVLQRVRRDWTSWRGRAVEPVVRDAVERLLPDERLPGVRHVGGWWNRQNNPEVDLVGGDQRRPAHLGFVGSVKWRENAPFDRADLVRLVADTASVPGTSPQTPMVAVSRSGVVADGLAASWSPEDLLVAWPG